MKKIILTVLLLTILATALFTVTAAASTWEDKVCEIVKQNERILDAKCIIYERSCLVAIKTEKFVTRSDYEEYLNIVTEEIKSQCEIDNVIVTRNPKVMQKINKLLKLDEKERQEKIKEIIERELNKGIPPITEIMPRLPRADVK